MLHPRLTFLSGPSFAVEVAREFPTAVTVAAPTTRSRWPCSTPSIRLRPYVTDDVVGVEIGGCAKECHSRRVRATGSSLYANTRAAITRGLAEITRLTCGGAGARIPDAVGRPGVGDLVLTCSSVKSRNYRVGFGLGQGRSLDDVCAELGPGRRTC